MNRKERSRQRRVEMTERIAYRLYQQRSKRGYEGSSEKDWQAAEKIARNPIVCSSFRLNQWFENRWRQSIGWYESTPIEHALETLTEDLKNLAVFDLVALLANLAIIISLGSFLTNGEQQRHDQQVYEAWQVITNAYGQPGNGGRRRALEFLNSTPGTPGRRRWFGIPWPKESLQGVDIAEANLAWIELPGADLWEANLEQTNLWEANLEQSILGKANLQKAILGFANFGRANLEDANLAQAYLWKINFQQTSLENASLQQTSLGKANLQEADLQHVNLQQASLWYTNLRQANLENANFQQAILLFTDLRASKNLTGRQLITAKLCNVALPDYIQDIDPKRDCEAMPQLLVEYSAQKLQINPKFYKLITLERATEIVEDARQREWDTEEEH